MAMKIEPTDFLCQRVRVARKDRGFTQEYLAEKAGVSVEAINHVENGTILRPREIVPIAIALDVNPAWLQFGDTFANRQLPVAVKRQPANDRTK